MPAIYAHRAFGEDIRQQPGAEQFPEIDACPRAFALGLHGPDTLFYFHPLRHNAVNERGERMHEARAADFFAGARDTLRARGDRPSDRAYLYGFVCHFALDSACHPEVAAQMRLHKISHTAAEAAFERAMLLRDGCDPVKEHIASHIRADADNVSAVAAFCKITEKQAKTAIRSMGRCSRLLRCPNGVRRALLRGILRLIGSRSVSDMIIPERDTPASAECCAALSACYARALQKAMALLDNFRAFLAEEAPLDERFFSNYESEETI